MSELQDIYDEAMLPGKGGHPPGPDHDLGDPLENCRKEAQALAVATRDMAELIGRFVRASKRVIAFSDRHGFINTNAPAMFDLRSAVKGTEWAPTPPAPTEGQ